MTARIGALADTAGGIVADSPAEDSGAITTDESGPVAIVPSAARAEETEKGVIPTTSASPTRRRGRRGSVREWRSRVRQLLPVVCVDVLVPGIVIAAVLVGVRGGTDSRPAIPVAYGVGVALGIVSLLNASCWFVPRWRSLGQRCQNGDGEPAGGSMVIRWCAVGLSLAAVVALAAGTIASHLGESRRDAETTRLWTAAPPAATSIVTQLLTYKYPTVTRDVATAQSRLTGQFADYYRTYTQNVVIPTAVEKKVVTLATVSGSSVVSADATSATVLLFITQNTTSTDDPEPVTSTSDIVVRLVDVDGTLKLDRLNPA